MTSWYRTAMGLLSSGRGLAGRSGKYAGNLRQSGATGAGPTAPVRAPRPGRLATAGGIGVELAGAVCGADQLAHPDERHHREHAGDDQAEENPESWHGAPASLEIDRVADQRAGHAVPAAAAAAQFGTDDRDDLDPGLAQQRIGAGVAVISEDHTGSDRDEVVAAVPLLPLVSVGLAAEVDDPQVRQVQRGGHHVDEAVLLRGDFDLGLVPRPQRERVDAVHDLREGGHA